MQKTITCIECPAGCTLAVDYEGCIVQRVSGEKCPKGAEYAKNEIQNPQRILTTAVLCDGLEVKMLAVRTDKPIPKQKLFEAMEAVRTIRVNAPVKAGETIVKDLLGLGADLVATRTAARQEKQI
ncbi:MAG: DUF1667 domain-containing protein [Candidatus Omnitrophica bacterium]|nr:DUF1667 domain-containing protein [Candidatus Omnitrophota bacterium]